MHTFQQICQYCFIKFTFIFLQTPLGLDYKDCLIIKNKNYSLPGVQKSFSSLGKLTNYYQHTKLLLAEVPVKLGRCCPPRPKGENHSKTFYIVHEPCFLHSVDLVSLHILNMFSGLIHPVCFSILCCTHAIFFISNIVHMCVLTLHHYICSIVKPSVSQCPLKSTRLKEHVHTEIKMKCWRGSLEETSLLFCAWSDIYLCVLVMQHAYLYKHMCCSAELTNLIIIRNGSAVEAQGSPTPERNKFSHIQFHMIKYGDLKWVSVRTFLKMYKDNYTNTTIVNILHFFCKVISDFADFF